MLKFEKNKMQLGTYAATDQVIKKHYNYVNQSEYDNQEMVWSLKNPQNLTNILSISCQGDNQQLA